MKSGIYCIIINNKKYVGCSLNIENRIKTHLSKLKNNKHINIKMQNTFNNHCSDINIVILEKTNQWLYEKEVMWISLLNSYNDGLNLTEGGEFPNVGRGVEHHFYGKHLSKEHKNKISKSQKGCKKPGTSRGLKINNPMFKKEIQDKLRIKNIGRLNPSYRHDLDEEKIVEMFKKERNMNKIAREFECSPHTIKNRLKAKGLL